MKSIRLPAIFLSFALVAVEGLPVLPAQQPASPQKDPNAEADERIIAEVRDHNEIMANLEYLSDMIGQRLTGSENLKKANEWTRRKFADYGLAKAQLESWSIGHGWTRGTAYGRILSPAEHPLTIASYGWGPNTNGKVRGPVVYVKASNQEELNAYKGKLKGAILITGEPLLLPAPDEPAPSPLSIPEGDSILLVRPERPGPRPAPAPRGPGGFRFEQARTEFFKQEGVLAILTDSGKPDGLLNMTGVGGRDFHIGVIPAAFITSENYSLIWRLLRRGPVEAELEINNTITDHPVDVYNTVAELLGATKPDEVVVLGAHLDSWDLGTGTTDNGTGSMVVLEAARALQKSGLRPARTIRFILFSGEEEGLVGSRAYVAAHKDELAKISAAIAHDTGTGRVLTLSLMRNYQDQEIMAKVVAPLHSLGLIELSQRWMAGTDHASFEQAGVPGFFFIQEPAQYFQTHHSQADTFDQAQEAGLVQGAQAMAAVAYNIAQLPQLLPRKPAPPATETSGP
ncbi:MAG TPA: M20/M25/M40 family metallo-hydrolase [Candidatus Acidoferrales bacterium]|nr:M20/M25/M40 family metallo-hydrolase [Candidatus Acidoferrales bacterium]